MTSILTDNSKIRSEPDALLQRPQLAAQIGNIAANWASVEEQIMFLYALLLGTDLPHRDDGTPRSHPIAFQIFSALYALDRRIDLLERLLDARAEPQEAEDFERRLKPLLKKRFNERSKVVHAVWGISDDYPDALILYNIMSEWTAYRLNDFEQISERIKKLGEDLTSFGGPIFLRLHRPQNALYRPKSAEPAQPRSEPEKDSGPA